MYECSIEKYERIRSTYLAVYETAAKLSGEALIRAAD
jgi:hypothetical protein